MLGLGRGFVLFFGLVFGLFLGVKLLDKLFLYAVKFSFVGFVDRNSGCICDFCLILHACFVKLTHQRGCESVVLLCKVCDFVLVAKLRVLHTFVFDLAKQLILAQNRLIELFVQLFGNGERVLRVIAGVRLIGRHRHKRFILTVCHNLNVLDYKCVVYRDLSCGFNAAVVVHFLELNLNIEKGSSWVLAVTVSYFEFIGNQLVGLSVLAAAAAAVIAVSIVLILKTSARIVKPVRSCTKRIELLAEGDLKSDMPDMEDFKSNDETGVLVESTRRNIRHLNSMIRHISDSLEQMAAGDFTHETEGKFRGDFAPIKASLDNIVGSLHSVLADIDSASAAMSEISEQVVDTSCSLADGVNHQTELIGQISDTFEEMKESIKLNAENTANVLELASKTKSGVKTSGNQMNELLEAMREMEKLSKEIRSINDTISDIAFQTHILAINASIEAAAVGEAGKGFTVVANEVGHLSAKCAESVSKTTALIERTVKAINDGTRLAQTVSESFGDVEADTAEVEKNIADISASSQEQAERIESVSEKMNTISSVVETTAVSSEKSAEISEKLKYEAESLKNIVSGFTLKKSQNP